MKGYVILDARRPSPSLRHAVGSRVYMTRRGAEARMAEARLGRAPEDAASLAVVPAEDVDCEGVTVGANGYLSYAGWK